MGKHLVIAGHGKQPSGRIDYGAEGNGYKENNLTKELCTLMDAYVGDDFEFITDYDVYGFRAMKNLSEYTTVTEVHFNAFNQLSYGCEVLIHEEFAPDEIDERILAVLSQYFKSRGFKKRSNALGNRIENMEVAKANNINYRLMEVCFIDSASDMKIYQANKKQIARKLAEAIVGWAIAEPEAVAPVVVADVTVYRVQVGAYKTKANAEKMKEKLKAAGFEAVIK